MIKVQTLKQDTLNGYFTESTSGNTKSELENYKNFLRFWLWLLFLKYITTEVYNFKNLYRCHHIHCASKSIFKNECIKINDAKFINICMSAFSRETTDKIDVCNNFIYII